MTKQRRMTAIDQCILWNRDKAKRAKSEKDRARYEDNIKNLQAFKEASDNASK